MEVVKAEPVNTMNQGDLSDDECLYQFTVDLIQTDKILLNVFNVQTGITYKQYIDKDDEWYKSNIYIFQGNFSKVRNILSQSLVKESKQLPYLITEKTNELEVKINYEHDMYPFELILTVPQHVSKSGVLEDRINSLEYQVKRLKQKLSQKNERQIKNDNNLKTMKRKIDILFEMIDTIGPEYMRSSLYRNGRWANCNHPYSPANVTHDPGNLPNPVAGCSGFPITPKEYIQGLKCWEDEGKTMVNNFRNGLQWSGYAWDSLKKSYKWNITSN